MSEKCKAICDDENFSLKNKAVPVNADVRAKGLVRKKKALLTNGMERWLRRLRFAM